MPKQSISTRGMGGVYQRGPWFWLTYYVSGVRKREPAKTKIREEAVSLLRRKLGKVAAGEDLTPENVLVKDLMDLVINDYELRGKSTYIETLRIKTHILPGIGNVKASKLSSTAIESYIRRRLKEAQPSTVNRDLSLIRRGFKLGYRRDPPLVARVPHVPKLEEDNVRAGFVKADQYARILEALPDDLKLLFVFGYHTGLRRGALLQLKWAQVDRKEEVVWLEGKKTKNKKPVPVAVPIYGDMGMWLDRQPKTSDYLFARGKKQILNIRRAWELACTRAGVPEMLFHDLRRTAARNLRRAGVPETVIMQITGHKTPSIFRRYNIIDTEDMREAGKKGSTFLKSEHGDED